MKYVTALLILFALPAAAQESQSDFYQRAIEPHTSAEAQSSFQRSYDGETVHQEEMQREQQAEPQYIPYRDAYSPNGGLQ